MIRRCSLLLALVIGLVMPQATLAQADQRCFAETGQCISGRIRQFWEQNGGLSVFGFPTGPQHEELIEGKPFQVQLFERNRLELHPENAAPYDVLLGRLAADRLAQQGRDPFTFPKSEPQPGCRFFPETGHNICGEILAAWRASGLEFDGRRGKSEAENLALFGLPLSDAQAEEIQGQSYTVQWFERARFELHPENQPPFRVLLGLLGNELRDNAGPAPTPGAAVCDGLPPSTDGEVSPACVRGGNLIKVKGVGFTPGERVGMHVTMPDGSAVEFPIWGGDRVPDSNGVYNVQGAMGAAAPGGVYALTIQGVDSGHRTIVFFKLSDPAASPPPPVDYSLIPAGINATANPDHGPVGTVFRFQTTGFVTGATVELFAVLPDGKIIRAEFQTTADGNGDAANRVNFVSDDAENTQLGVYAIHFKDVSSPQEAIAYIRITPFIP